MMKYIALLILLVPGCANPQTEQQASTPDPLAAILSSCFEKYIGKLDEMLTREDILSVHTSGMDRAELKYYQTGPAEYHSCTYEWQSDRTTPVKSGGFERSIPKPNRIGVWGLSLYDEKIKDPLAHFKNTYRTPTAEEKAHMQQALDRKMEEEGLSTAQKETGTELTTSTMDKIRYETIGGFGDAAAWDFMDSALVIHLGRTKFKLIVDISDNAEENQDVAQKLARRMLEKC